MYIKSPTLQSVSLLFNTDINNNRFMLCISIFLSQSHIQVLIREKKWISLDFHGFNYKIKYFFLRSRYLRCVTAFYSLVIFCIFRSNLSVRICAVLLQKDFCLSLLPSLQHHGQFSKNPPSHSSRFSSAPPNCRIKNRFMLYLPQDSGHQ